MNKITSLFIVTVLSFGGHLHLWAAAPEIISYQGKLTNASGTPDPGPTKNFSISIYDSAAGGNLRFGPEAQPGIAVVNGVFNLQIGSVNTNQLKSAMALCGANCYLDITVGGQVLTPRQRLLAAPSALAVVDGGVSGGTGGTIADESITSADILNDTIVDADIKTTAAIQGSKIFGNINGNAGTATALAADGADCTAGNFPLGVDAYGAVVDCTDAATQAELTSHANLTNTAHSATSVNNINTIVARDGTGNFSAGKGTFSSMGVAGNGSNAADLKVGFFNSGYPGYYAVYAPN